MKNKKRRWIWLRGLIRWQVHWGDFLGEFQKAFPDDEIQMIDFPGFGSFHHLASPRDMNQMVEHVRNQIQDQKGPFHLLAFSLGAMVAAQFSDKYPELVAQQFLINTSDKKSPFYLRFQPKQWHLVFSNFLNPQAEKVEKGILETVSNDPQTRQRYYKEFVEAYKNTPVKRRNLLNQIHIASRVEFPNRPKVPSVLLASRGDQLVHFSCTEKIADAWGVRAQMHPNGGHDLSLDAPHWVVEKIQENLL